MKKLTVFFLLSYLISWLIWLPLYGPAIGIEHLPVLPFHHALGAFGPLIAAFVCAGIFKGIKVRDIVYRMFSTKAMTPLFIALLGPFLLVLFIMAILYIVNGSIPGLASIGRSIEFEQWNIFMFTLYNLLTFGYGEETGWRGYALPVLQKRFSSLLSALILTLFWAGWHTPLFIYRPGYNSMDIAGITGWFFSLLTGSILLTWLYNKSSGSILVCAIFHATIDVIFTSAYTDKNIVNYLGAAITIAGIIAVVPMVKKKAAGTLPVLTDNNQYSG